MTNVYLTKTPEETEEVAALLAKSLIDAGLRRAYVALYGDMGVGKTAFARGFGSALGCKNVKSPTYTVVTEHRGSPVPLFHFDLYRLGGSEDLVSVGYDDYLLRDGYILTEWSERIPDEIPLDAITVRITRTDNENGRKIEIGGTI